MKYFTYVSETKIEMLYGQLEGRESAEELAVGVDVKIFKLQKKKTAGTQGLYGKLKAVEDRLSEAGVVGDVYSDKQYISGTLPMHAGGYGWSHQGSPIAFWGYGSDDSSDGVIVALAGSRYHVIGEQRQSGASSHSLTDQMTVWFLENLPDEFSEADHQTAAAALEPHCRLNLTEYDVANGAYLAAGDMHGPVRNFGFLAKVLHRSDWPEGFRMSGIRRIILGSPLYVSLEE